MLKLKLHLLRNELHQEVLRLHSFVNGEIPEKETFKIWTETLKKSHKWIVEEVLQISAGNDGTFGNEQQSSFYTITMINKVCYVVSLTEF